MRDLIKVTDPLSNTTLLKPYENGVLETLVDPDGNATQFGIDVESWVTGKAYADKSV